MKIVENMQQQAAEYPEVEMDRISGDHLYQWQK